MADGKQQDRSSGQQALFHRLAAVLAAVRGPRSNCAGITKAAAAGAARIRFTMDSAVQSSLFRVRMASAARWPHWHRDSRYPRAPRAFGSRRASAHPGRGIMEGCPLSSAKATPAPMIQVIGSAHWLRAVHGRACFQGGAANRSGVSRKDFEPCLPFGVFPRRHGDEVGIPVPGCGPACSKVRRIKAAARSVA